MPEPLPIPCDRLVLRRLSPLDLPAFQAYRHDPEVGRYQGWRPQSDPEALAFLEEMASTALFPAGGWVQLGIADPRTDLLLGDLGLFVAEDGASAELGFTLCAQAQGRGLGTEAVRQALRLLFRSTAILQAHGITDARNAATIRLLERIGMRRTATKDALFRDEPCIEHTYTILRREWERTCVEP